MGLHDKEGYVPGLAEHTQAATVLVGDTYETPTGAAEYAQSEREALAFLGDEKCAAELAEHTQAACDTIKAASE